jgi:non-specific serine/threonine protein kinase
MHQQELNVIVHRDRLLLEWASADNRYTEPSLHFQQELYRHYQREPEAWLLFLSFSDPSPPLSPSLTFWRHVTGHFAEQLAHVPDLEDTRDEIRVKLEDDTIQAWLATAPLCTGSEYLDADLIATIWADLHDTFHRLLRSYSGTVEAFIHAYRPNLQLAGRVFFHLVENNKGEAPFAFLATYSTRLGGDGTSRHLPLKYALQEYSSDRSKLLELLGPVYRAARQSALLPHLLERGELFHPLGWGPNEAYTFLQEVSLYEQSGILCRIPNWWRAHASGPRLSLTIGSDQPPFVGLEAILNCQPSLSVNGIPISPDEARQLLAESDGLALIKNKWVAVDQEKLRQTLQAYERARAQLEDGELTLRQALALQLHPEKLLGNDAINVEVGVAYGAWFEAVNRKLRQPNLVEVTSPAAGFLAALRPYQQTGLNWLGFMDGLGFGACLADDMGLGKTVQVLAFLSAKQCQKITSLLVVPASLMANWCSEIDKFYPALAYTVAHPGTPDRARSFNGPQSKLSAYDLVITTYAMVQRYEVLQTFDWDYVILDEAQAIKNPATQQARAVKRLHAANRIVLTGTPMENRLSDLWSIFDFLNPGLLGNRQEFKTFTQTLKDDAAGYGRLRQVISPYILRRLKTDKTIIGDLPDKIEMKTYAALSKKQTVLYRGLLSDIAGILANSEGVQRRGLILSSLMKFKQLCNHPDQFLGTGDFDAKHSGKFQRLREICETVADKREKMLIFTQFREITSALHDFLAPIFGREGVVLHGSVPVRKRQALVNAFQNRER